MPASGDNAKGYWESLEVYEIHEALLRALDFDWDDVRPLPHAWRSSDAASAARAALRAWIVREFAQTELWAVKDPRLCRFIPLWLDVLRDLRIEPVVLMVVRNPREVAESIRVRGEWPEAVGQALWLRHLAEAEEGSRHTRRCALTYEQLLASPEQTLATAASRLGLVLPRAPQDAPGELRAFVETKYRHQKSDESMAPGGSSEIAACNSQLYVAMQYVSAKNEGWDQVQRLTRLGSESIDRQGYCLYALASGLGRLRRAQERALAAADHARADAERARADAEHARAQADRLHDELNALCAQIPALREQLHASECRLQLVLHSRSWRVTAPLRWVKRLAAGSPRPTSRTGLPLSEPESGAQL